MKIAIVGGGTAGFVAALILKTKYPDYIIDIICSKKIGIVGVGEGTTEHWTQFMRYVDIPYQKLIQECDATFKCGIKFSGWGGNDFMHSVGREFEIKNGQYLTIYGKYLSENFPNKSFNPNFSWENQIYAKCLFEESEPPWYQFHFNTYKLNSFLEKISASKGITVIDDEINDVVLREIGAIENLIGSKKTYHYDFYIDCTGFARLLIGKMDTRWKSFKKYLKVNSAITFPTPETEEYPMWTLAQAMESGWMFRLPVWGRYGNGYIYDDNFITKDRAKQEVEKYLGYNVDIGKEFKFDPGSLEKVWVKNCCAIGLSSIFLEPLEATSIGTSIQQTFLLADNLDLSYNEDIIDDYNKKIDGILENMRDFVLLHYLCKRSDTDFWKSISEIELPDSLGANLEKWKKRLPRADDFVKISPLRLFNEANHIQILNGLKLFDIESIRAEYSRMPPMIREMADSYVNEITKQQSYQTIDHRQFLSHIRTMSV